jgi:RNA polymerase sigma-70 factor, ECF subfamily
LSFSHNLAASTDRPLSTGQFRRGPGDDRSEREQSMVARAVVCAKQGDSEGLRYLYVRYADRVYGYVRSIVRDQHEAEDVTQQVFAKLMLVLPKYEQRETPFVAWMLRVARNVAMDHLRHRRPTPCEEVRGADAMFTGSDPSGSLSVKDALACLPPDQREVVFLRHVAGLTPGEIALRLGRSEPSVHGLHHRGRGTLRTTLVQMDLAPAVMAS